MAKVQQPRRAQATRTRRRERKNIETGRGSYPVPTFNNTIVTITDLQRQRNFLVLPLATWASAARRKCTPFAAQTAAETAAKPLRWSTA